MQPASHRGIACSGTRCGMGPVRKDRDTCRLSCLRVVADGIKPSTCQRTVLPGFERPRSNCPSSFTLWVTKSRSAASPALLLSKPKHPAVAKPQDFVLRRVKEGDEADIDTIDR